MKTLLQNKVKFLILMFLALSLSAFSVPGVKSNYITKKDKHEYKSLKGVCKCYKQKAYKESNKNRKFQKRKNRSNK
jgi:hypothetical protein